MSRPDVAGSRFPRSDCTQWRWMFSTLSWMLCQGRDAQLGSGGETSCSAVPSGPVTLSR
nr:hypothetical protein [uncultured Lichenicoccus sp.]